MWAKRIIRGIHRLLDELILLFCLNLMLLGGYALYDTAVIYHHASDETLLKYKPESNDAGPSLKELSEDAVAWLTIEGTTIDYPVMQGRDNMQYINQDPHGAFSLSGSIFLDCRNRPDFRDSYSLLYGHHMEGGHMFGALDAFLDESYFRKHRRGTLTAGGRKYQLELIAVMMTDVTETAVFEPGEGRLLRPLLKKSARIYLEPEWAGSDETRILGMSTCTDAMNEERLVVFGVLTEG